MQSLLPSARPVDCRRFVKVRVHAGQGRHIDDRSPAEAFPDIGDNQYGLKQFVVQQEKDRLHPEQSQQLIHRSGRG